MPIALRPFFFGFTVIGDGKQRILNIPYTFSHLFFIVEVKRQRDHLHLESIPHPPAFSDGHGERIFSLNGWFLRYSSGFYTRSRVHRRTPEGKQLERSITHEEIFLLAARLLVPSQQSVSALCDGFNGNCASYSFNAHVRAEASRPHRKTPTKRRTK